MKRIISKLTFAFAAALFAGAVTGAHGQDTIVYSSGPSLPFQYGANEPSDAAIDLNGDGAPDFSFQLGYFICTADIPVSACSGPYYVLALGTNAILSQRFSQAAILPWGAWISSTPATNSTWSNSDQGATVATDFFSARFGTRGLFGPLADVGVGYAGVRFYAADGLHYGWVRLRIAPFVTAVDWAYEGRPNTPIRAGVIGRNGESVQFAVNFQGQSGAPSGTTGTFILTGNTLRGELTLGGLFSSADLAGPAPARANAKPFANLGQPLVATTNFTSFLGDLTVSRSEIIQLRRGANFVSLDGGAVVGPISPLR